MLLTLAVVPLPASAQGLVGPAYVTRVVAGDTVYAEVGGRLEVIRYLGVNSPLIEHPTRGADAYADAVREINRQLVEGRWIRLGFDDQPRDRYGRLLAYVWVGNLFVNAAMIHYGYGEAAASTTSTRYGEYFRTLEVGARQDARGLWRDPEALTYHRPRPAERESAGDYEERAADASGGRVFSAPAPFIPAATPTSSVPTVGVPGGPVAPRASPSYIPPGGVTRPR